MNSRAAAAAAETSEFLFSGCSFLMFIVHLNHKLATEEAGTFWLP